MYTEDSRDILPYSKADARAKAAYSWVQGYLDFNPNNRSNRDLVMDIKKSPLWAYSGKAPGIWRCPADSSKIRLADGRVLPRVRTMSPEHLGGEAGGGTMADSKERTRVAPARSGRFIPSSPTS